MMIAPPNAETETKTVNSGRKFLGSAYSTGPKFRILKFRKKPRAIRGFLRYCTVLLQVLCNVQCKKMLNLAHLFVKLQKCYRYAVCIITVPGITFVKELTELFA